MVRGATDRGEVVTSKADRKKPLAAALRDLLGVDVNFNKLSSKELEALAALFADPGEVARRITSGILQERGRAGLGEASKTWKPGMFLQMLGKGR